jgi:phenylalanyl-tRNA synthetase beta chain
MKLSIAWIFDHIDAPWRSIDIPDLVARFNKTTAEIESMHRVCLDLDKVCASQVLAVDAHALHMRVLHADRETEVFLPVRTDLRAGQWTLVVQTDDTYRWATATDCGGQRDFNFPALQLDDSSDWKAQIERDDYILTVDNKSITNRPDLWGHRGFAREIAAILDLPLKPLEHFLAPIPVIRDDAQCAAADGQPWSVTINAGTPCNSLALSYVDSVLVQPSQVTMAARLARVDLRPINAIVDVTNYVMGDLGQPMHAFDAHKLKSKTITVRMAHDQESLQTLDHATLTLNTHDMVIADGSKPIALAGIRGGLDSSITLSTTALVLESPNFDATTIRHSSERHKLRTEASTRAEKSLDPIQTVQALQRFVCVAGYIGIPMHIPSRITAVGRLPKTTVLQVSHICLESRLGVSLSPSFVIDTLKKLEFNATVSDAMYTVEVPTFRATKDITIAEDIVEEIGRFYGYDKIVPQLPVMRLAPHDLTGIMRLREIKKYLAYAHQMSELYSYALYDESFLSQIGYVPQHTLQVKDPVSANWQRLVTSLIPHLSKAVAQNATTQDQLRFFEWGRTWQYDGHVSESKKLAGIIFDKRTPVDFYYGKTIIEDMLRIVGLKNVRFAQATKPSDPWYAPYLTAELIYGTQSIGSMGIVPDSYRSFLVDGHALVFELDGDFLIDTPTVEKRFVPSSKFPDVQRDVSVLVGRQHNVASLQTLIASSDPRVVSVELVDFFEKDEWADKRSVSLRYVICDTTKTLTTQEVDAISDRIVQDLRALGGVIR